MIASLRAPPVSRPIGRQLLGVCVRVSVFVCLFVCVFVCVCTYNRPPRLGGTCMTQSHAAAAAAAETSEMLT